MSQIIGWLAGAPQAAQTTGNFYTGAANDIYNTYGPSATQYFTNEQNLALRPGMQQQENALSGNLAAQGITKSGAGINAFGNLGSQQAGALASADAPLFSQGLSGAAGVYQQMPGAQTSSYNDAIQQFYQAVSDAAAFAGGIPGGGGGQPGAGQTPGGMGSYSPSSGSYYTQGGVPFIP